MEENSSNNFDFEKYQEMHEGLFRRFIRRLGKLLNQFFKPICTLAAFGIIIQTIGVIDQLTTSDAGKTIEKVYAEAREAAHETQNLMYVVELPDSLENTSEVIRIRLFQNRIFKYSNMYLSIVQSVKQYSDVDMMEKFYDTEEKKIALINSMMKQIQQMGLLSTQIIIDTKEDILPILEHDSIAICSVNMNQMNKVLKAQVLYNETLGSTYGELRTACQTKNIKSLIKVMMKIFKDDNFNYQYKEMRSMNIMLFMVTNQRLLSIKNQGLENRIDYRKNSTKEIKK